MNKKNEVQTVAADGVTKILHAPGMPLMVSAADFNAIYAKLQLAQKSSFELVAGSYHQPGLGEVHNADHTEMIYCTDGDDVVNDALAKRVCILLKGKHCEDPIA